MQQVGPSSARRRRPRRIWRNPFFGTPAHALVVATADLPERYYATLGTAGTLARANLRRADVTYFETPFGGAVFSAGSIGWVCALSHNDDGNALSRLTANVLRAFSRSDRTRGHSSPRGTPAVTHRPCGRGSPR